MGFVHYLWRPPTRLKLLAGVKPPWIANNSRGKYLAQIVLSTPPWLSREQRAEIMAMHEEAKRLTATTGILHVLDHKEPVNHPDVCGLTVPWNLQIVTWRVNAAKGNRRPNPDQRELFSETEQAYPLRSLAA